MTKTTYLINNKFVRIPDSPDPVTTINVTEKEINLIKVMREVKSQDNTYEVQVITRYYPGGYMTYEYHDTFKTGDTPEIKKPKYYKCQNCGKIIDEETYQNNIKNGSMGMCFCEYSPESRILNSFFIIKGDN